MNYDDCRKELSAKVRTVSDLARFVSNRTDHNPNYSLLLGAGCSVSSGIRSASTLCEVWRRDLYLQMKEAMQPIDASVDQQKEYLRQHQGIWYEASREYSSLFEKRYDLQRQRRMFVEAEVASKLPSIGYAYLTALVQKSYFNTIFTTNFDDLLNEAFYLYSSQRPIVCAHDSSINSVTVTSKRPKIIKLHGDYLFDDLKATNRETETLEQNMKAKFSEFARDYGLIVVGYSGSDRSVMDVLHQLLKSDECFKGGIYWCLRKNSEVSEDLRKLLWRERVFIVPTDGFDELFADMYAQMPDGAVLPSEALEIVRPPTEIVRRLLDSKTAFPETTDNLRQARALLELRSKRTAIANLITKSDRDDDGKPLSGSDITDDELLLLTQVQVLYSDGKYQEAIVLARKHADAARADLRLMFLGLIVSCYRRLGGYSEAMVVVDELIGMQPKHTAHFLTKASLNQRPTENLKWIDRALDVNPFAYGAYAAKARELLDQAGTVYGQRRVELLKQAEEALKKGIPLNPSWTNPCWAVRFSSITDFIHDPKECRTEQDDVINALSLQNPYSERVLRMRMTALRSSDKDVRVSTLVDDLDEAIQRADQDGKARFQAIKLQVFAKCKPVGEIRTSIDSLLETADVVRDETLTRAVAKVLRQKIGDDERAILLLKQRLEFEFDEDVFDELFEAHIRAEQVSNARELMQTNQGKLHPARLSRCIVELMETSGDFEAAIRELHERAIVTGVFDSRTELFLTLKLKRYEKAEQLAKAILSPILFSSEAISETVNYELARKRLGRTPDNGRLSKLLAFEDDHATVAAVLALQEKRVEMLAALRRKISEDKSFRYHLAHWPVFEEYQDDLDFQKLRIDGGTILSSVAKVA